MESLSFGFRDCFIALKLGWSYRKMSIAFRGILSAWGMYLVFSYAALILNGGLSAGGFASLFRQYEFFPYICLFRAGLFPSVIWLAGIMAAVLTLDIAAAFVSRIAFQDLRGHDVYQVSEARDHTRAVRKPLLIAVLTPAVLALIMLVPTGLVGFAGRIPLFGPVMLAIFSLLLEFWVFAALAVIYVFLVGLFQVPAIAAVSGGDALELIIESFSVSLKRPLLQLLFQVTARIAMLTGALILLSASLAGFLLMIAIVGNTMGFAFSEIFTVALYRIPGALGNMYSWISLLWIGYYLNVPLIVDTTGCSLPVTIAGWLSGISILLWASAAVSYLFSVCFSAQVIIYLSLKKRLSGEDLRLKKDIDYFIPDSIED